VRAGKLPSGVASAIQRTPSLGGNACGAGPLRQRAAGRKVKVTSGSATPFLHRSVARGATIAPLKLAKHRRRCSLLGLRWNRKTLPPFNLGCEEADARRGGPFTTRVSWPVVEALSRGFIRPFSRLNTGSGRSRQIALLAVRLSAQRREFSSAACCRPHLTDSGSSRSGCWTT
jgi:hypothetical protein